MGTHDRITAVVSQVTQESTTICGVGYHEVRRPYHARLPRAMCGVDGYHEYSCQVAAVVAFPSPGADGHTPVEVCASSLDQDIQTTFFGS